MATPSRPSYLLFRGKDERTAVEVGGFGDEAPAKVVEGTHPRGILKRVEEMELICDKLMGNVINVGKNEQRETRDGKGSTE